MSDYEEEVDYEETVSDSPELNNDTEDVPEDGMETVPAAQRKPYEPYTLDGWIKKRNKQLLSNPAILQRRKEADKRFQKAIEEQKTINKGLDNMYKAEVALREIERNALVREKQDSLIQDLIFQKEERETKEAADVHWKKTRAILVAARKEEKGKQQQSAKLQRDSVTENREIDKQKRREAQAIELEKKKTAQLAILNAEEERRKLNAQEIRKFETKVKVQRQKKLGIYKAPPAVTPVKISEEVVVEDRRSSYSDSENREDEDEDDEEKEETKEKVVEPEAPVETEIDTVSETKGESQVDISTPHTGPYRRLLQPSALEALLVREQACLSDTVFQVTYVYREHQLRDQIEAQSCAQHPGAVLAYCSGERNLSNVQSGISIPQQVHMPLMCMQRIEDVVITLPFDYTPKALENALHPDMKYGVRNIVPSNLKGYCPPVSLSKYCNGLSQMLEVYCREKYVQDQIELLFTQDVAMLRRVNHNERAIGQRPVTQDRSHPQSAQYPVRPTTHPMHTTVPTLVKNAATFASQEASFWTLFGAEPLFQVLLHNQKENKYVNKSRN